MKILTEKQQKFCCEYVRCGNATEAYSRAFEQGNRVQAGKSASALLQQKKIQDYIQLLATQVNNERIADLEECLALLTGIMRDSDASRNERMKAADLRLKTLGAYIDKKQIDMDTTVEIEVNIDED